MDDDFSLKILPEKWWRQSTILTYTVFHYYQLLGQDHTNFQKRQWKEVDGAGAAIDF